MKGQGRLCWAPARPRRERRSVPPTQARHEELDLDCGENWGRLGVTPRDLAEWIRLARVRRPLTLSALPSPRRRSRNPTWVPASKLTQSSGANYRGRKDPASADG